MGKENIAILSPSVLTLVEIKMKLFGCWQVGMGQSYDSYVRT